MDVCFSMYLKLTRIKKTNTYAMCIVCIITSCCQILSAGLPSGILTCKLILAIPGCLLWHVLVGINLRCGYYLCCKVDRNPGQKLAYTFQLVDAIYPLKLRAKTPHKPR